MIEKHHKQSGFTIIELTLSITFLGVMMIFVTLATIQAIGIYNKGFAIKQINQAGRTLIEDINRLSSSGHTISIDDNGTAGYLCVEYGNSARAIVWNSLRDGAGGSTPSGGDTHFVLNGQPIGLLRTNDGIDGSIYCGLPSGSDRTINPAHGTSLLTPQVRILSVDIVTSNNSDLTKIAFWIGTSDGTPDGSSIPGMSPTFNAGTWSCQGGSIGDFCAVSKFETIIYTPNSEGEE